MKNAKISRRSFLLGLAACSAAGILTACKGDDTPASSASTSPEAPASSVSELEPIGLFTVEDFPKLDGSTACIPLMAQMMADTTGIDLEVAQSGISVSTTAYAWENFGLYPDEEYTARMLVVYEAPDYVKEELKEANAQLEQKPIGRDALVFIVNENNPVKSLTRQQLKDIYAGKITNWKEVGGEDLRIQVINRDEASGTREAFRTIVMDGTPFDRRSAVLSGTGQVRDVVSRSRGAIGYISLGFVDSLNAKTSVKAVSVNHVEASEKTVASGGYPISRDLYFFVKGAPSQQAQDYIDYVTSEKMDKQIREAGFIPVTNDEKGRE